METFAGYCTVELVDDSSGMVLPMAIMYPTSAAEKTESVGPYRLNVSTHAAPKNGAFPLVLISHGSGVSHMAHCTLSRHLARNGFIVGMPEHPFNNDRDNRLQGTTENLIYRPRHLRAAADWFFDSAFAACLRPDAVSIIGHSLGGYTALALAGGVPTSLLHEAEDGLPRRIQFAPDHRIKALVLLAPATVWFTSAGALSEVKVPILMLAAEKDEYTPLALHAKLVMDGVPDQTKVQQRIVENAGHFSFLSPFPEPMTSAESALSQDPAGFDRKRFHDELNAEVLAFLSRQTG